MSADVVKVEAIRVEDRARQDYSGIETLAASIESLGLLHPIVVTPDLRLVAGGRRLEAVKALGWDETPVTVCTNLGEAVSILQAESDENTERMPLKPSEAAGLARKIEEVLAPLASARAGGRPKTGAKFAPVSEPKTREVAAKAAGLSHESIRKVRVVQEVIESDSTPEPVRSIASAALAEMDATGRIDAAHKMVKSAVTAAELVSEFPDLQHYLDRGETAKVVQLGNALRGYDEPERSMRLNNMRLSIAADQRRVATDASVGPDYYKLADRIFLAVNDAMQVVAKSGGIETVREATSVTNTLTLDLWRTQFEEAAETLTALADAVRPTLKAVK